MHEVCNVRKATECSIDTNDSSLSGTKHLGMIQPRLPRYILSEYAFLVEHRLCNYAFDIVQAWECRKLRAAMRTLKQS